MGPPPEDSAPPPPGALVLVPARIRPQRALFRLRRAGLPPPAGLRLIVGAAASSSRPTSRINPRVRASSVLPGLVPGAGLASPPIHYREVRKTALGYSRAAVSLLGLSPTVLRLCPTAGDAVPPLSRRGRARARRSCLKDLRLVDGHGSIIPDVDTLLLPAARKSAGANFPR